MAIVERTRIKALFLFVSESMSDPLISTMIDFELEFLTRFGPEL